MIEPKMKSWQIENVWRHGRVRRWTASASAALWGLLIAAAAPVAALAQEDEVKHDARLDGYTTQNVLVSNDSTALIWLLFVFLGVVALAALFKDAKRTHLD